jgi:hypothetical protein
MSRTLFRPFALVLTLAASAASADTITFGDLTLPANSFYNGSDGAGGFTSGGAFFNNSYNSTYGSWSGWSYSNVNDTTDPGYTNQYAAITGTAPADNPTGIYAVAYLGSPFINLPTGTAAMSMEVTNTTYTYLDVKNGDPYGFDQKYGPGDYLELRIFGDSGLNGSGRLGEVDVNLADFRNGNSFILSAWQTVNLAGLGSAESLSFEIDASADHYGLFGLDTPAYFALGNLAVGAQAVPEPSSFALVGLALVGLATGRVVRFRSGT